MVIVPYAPEPSFAAAFIVTIPLETAVRILTSNPASILKLPGKGFISNGMDADLLFLNKGMELVNLISMGKWVVKDGKVLKKGTYE